jgi:hypothetical protein
MSQINNDAREYWAVLDGPADGWGMHVHPQYGASHYMLLAMFKRHGQDAFSAALKRTRKRIRDEKGRYKS